MKHSLLYIAAFAMLATGAVSCSDEPSVPPLVVPSTTLEANTTISEVKTEYWSAMSAPATIGKKADGTDVIIAGRVVSNDAGGNVYKSLCITDGTAALAFSVDTTKIYKLYQYGQEVVVNLTGMSIGGYRGYMQVGGVNGSEISFMPAAELKAHAFQNGMPDFAKVDTVVVDLATIVEAKKSPEGLIKWQSRLVRFDDVTFLDQGEQFAPESNSDRYVADRNGNRINMRCSSYSSFAVDYVPSGYGSVVGILSYYNNDWQVLMLDRNSMIGFGAPVIPTPAGPEVYAQSFKKSQGLWYTENGSSSIDVWKHNATYGMVANGYASGQNLDTEAWLISPVFDLTKASGTTFSFRHACNYFSSVDILPEQASVWAREEGGQWKKLDGVRYPASLSWAFIGSGNIAVTEFDGKKMQIGFKYVSTSAKAGTWEVDDFVLNANGSVEVIPTGNEPSQPDTPDTPDVPDTPVDPDQPTIPSGEGTEASPYNCAQVIAMNPTGNGDNPDKADVWVAGYIVGWADMSSVYYINEQTATFSAPATLKTNILLADTPTAKEYTVCIGVQLPSGDVRNALNLQDNPTNLGKKVVIRGDIAKYSGVAGVRNTDKYILDGQTTPDTPDTPDTPTGDVIFSETFASGQGQFTIQDVTLEEGLTYVWKADSYGYMKASAYSGHAYASESWLISPIIDLGSASAPKFAFEHVTNFFGDTAGAKAATGVFVRVEGGEWTAVEAAYPSAQGWNPWTPSGDISLAAFAGKKIQVGFKYTSTSSASGTWEVKNFVVSK